MMPVSIKALPYAEMGIPVKAVYHNMSEFSPIRNTIGMIDQIEWNDGTVSEGIKHCGCVYLVIDQDKKILVDTGMGPYEKITQVRIERGDKFYLRPLVPIEEQLLSLGVSVVDIDIVINTHLHWDHCGGNLLFPNALFYMPDQDIPYAISTPRWAPHFFSGMRDCITEVADRTISVSGDKKITENVSIIRLGGHTPGSQGVLIRTKAGVVALAGDVVCKYENLENDWIGPAGNIWDVGALVSAVEKLRQLSDIIVPSHDWRVFDRFTDGIIA